MAAGTDPQTPQRTDSDARFSREGEAPVVPGLGDAAEVPRRGLRGRIRSNPALYGPYRVAVFLAGLVCMAVGVALAALPGPLTIPPVLLGLWIWSTEFAWADRFFRTMKRKASEAWAHARRHPVSSTLITAGGIAAAIAALWAVGRFDLVDRAQTALF